MIYHGGGSDETWADSDLEEEEALSLSDLPTFNDSENPSREESPKAIESQEEEFNFCSWSQDQSLNETELCAADDVFFQGQIVPMGKFAIKQICNQNEGISSIVEVPIMDHNSSSGDFTSTESSSRSSSLNSTSSSPTIIENKLPKTRVSNQFQFSHPSPKPHVRIPSSSTNTKNGYFSSSPNSRSGSWTLFRVGLVTTPEIGIQDLKARNNCKRSNGTGSHNNNNSKNEKKDNKKKEQSLFNKKGVLFSSCKCSASVIGTVNSASIVMKEEHHHHHHHYAKEEDKDKEKQKQQQQRAGKQSFSRHRTFEWLKQLSLETATDEF